MSKFSIEQLPKEDLQALGLFKDGQLTLDKNNKDALLNGRVTSLMRLQDINVDGLGIKSLDSKVSLQAKDDGTLGLFVHPIFKERVSHPNLSPEENEVFSRGGVHDKKSSAYGKITDFGAANYQDDPKNKPSFFIELEKFDGEKTKIWGVDLKRALESSGKNIGDMAQLEFQGKQTVPVKINGSWENKERYTWEVNDYIENTRKEKTAIYQFDKETNSFVAVDCEDVLVPEEVNGMQLTEEQKRKLKKGKIVDLADGTAIQAAPAAAKNSFLQSNRKFLIASMLLDGGMSFFLIKGIQLIAERSQRKQNDIYNKGYREALAKVQANLEMKAKEFPNNKEILDDLNIVKGEFNRVATRNMYNDAEEKNINETKAVVNDPELDDNAERMQREDDAKVKADEKIIHLEKEQVTRQNDEQEERAYRKR